MSRPRKVPMYARWSLTLRVALAALIVVIPGCSSTTGGDDDDDNEGIANAEALQASMEEWFMPAVNGVIDGFARLAVAVQGGGMDGVVIAPVGNGYQGQVSVDLDGDGARESTVTGQLNGDVAAGATMTVTGLVQPGSSGLALGASATVTQTSPVTILFDDLNATLNVDRPSTGNPAQGSITGGAIVVDLVSGTPTGFADVRVSEAGESADVTLQFEPNGAGGWRVRVTGNGIDFTLG